MRGNNRPVPGGFGVRNRPCQRRHCGRTGIRNFQSQGANFRLSSDGTGRNTRSRDDRTRQGVRPPARGEGRGQRSRQKKPAEQNPGGDHYARILPPGNYSQEKNVQVILQTESRERWWNEGATLRKIRRKHISVPGPYPALPTAAFRDFIRTRRSCGRLLAR